MKKYMTPEMEISELECMEILTTSGGDGVQTPDPGYESNEDAGSKLGW